MRADRLIAALMVMQTRGRITAAELADELEVSERTARRDLEALAMSGVPVYSQPGRGGGWQLIGGATTDLTGLSSDESRALFIALSQQPERDPVLEAALRKLVVALPEHFRNDALAAQAAIRVDTAGWGQIGRAERPAFVDDLSEAIVAATQCQISYQRPQDDEPAARTVHPLGLVTKRGVWYLIANTDRGLRTYRISRIHSVEHLDAAVERPIDFDLDREWERIVTSPGTQRAGATTRVRIRPDLVVAVRWMFGARFDEVKQLDDGSVEALVTEGSPTALAAQLSGLGAGVELLDPPPDIAAEMTRIARELATRWL